MSELIEVPVYRRLKILNPWASRLKVGKEFERLAAFGVSSSKLPAASTEPKNGVLDVLIATTISSVPALREKVSTRDSSEFFSQVTSPRRRAFDDLRNAIIAG